MSEFKRISPLLDHMTVLSSLGSHDGNACYLLKHDSLDKIFVLKLISVPQSEEKTAALLLAGAFPNKAAVNEYYGHLVEDLKQELDTIIKLGDSPNIAPVLGYQVEAKESGIGYDLYILTEHWQTLSSFAADNVMTNLRAVNLGIDICNALCTLRQANLLSQNIKPENIYADGQGHFLLGDLGIASMEYLQFSSLSEQYRSVYTPPEFADMMANLNPTMDTYSLGMLLYRIYNGNHGPFEDEKTSAAAAESRRLAGEEMPAPLYADYEIAEIILKACAPKPEDRYQTPEAMRQALMFYMQRNSITDNLIVPPIVADPEPPMANPEAEDTVEPVSFTDVSELDEAFVQNFSPNTQPLPLVADTPEEPADTPESSAVEAPQEPDVLPDPEDNAKTEQTPPVYQRHSKKKQPKEKKEKKKKPVALLSVAAVLLVLLVGACVFLYQWYFLDVNAITLVDKGADYITVTVDSPSIAKLTVTCYDSLSHTYTTQMDGNQATFTGLSSNTKYTVAVVAPTGHKLSRRSTESIDVTTYEATTISQMSLHAAEVTGQAELTITTESGPIPPKYILTYGCDGEEERTKEFSGDTYLITDLTVGKIYTFRLLDHDTYYMAGEFEAEFTILPPAEAGNLRISAVSDGQLSVVWDCTNNDPGDWTVTCVGDDGYEQSSDVSTCSATFSGTVLFASYTITVTSPALYTPLTLTVPANPICVENMTATEQDGQITVTWDSLAGTPEDGWQLEYRIVSVDLEPTVVMLDTTSYTIDNAVANATYEFTIRLGDEQTAAGDVTTTVTTGDAAQFDNYGISKSVLGPGLFSVPDKEDWTWRDLGQARTTFSGGESVVCVLQSDATPRNSEDSVSVTTVIRNADGTPIWLNQSDSVWNDLWSDLRFVCQVTAPEESGAYTIEIYIDGALLYSIKLTVD